jgi:glutamate synthase domain-containing protein 2
MNPLGIPPEFHIVVDADRCQLCGRCAQECSFGAIRKTERVEADDRKCVACQRCVATCPQGAIMVVKHPLAYAPHGTWSEKFRRDIWRQAETGRALLGGTGTPLSYPTLFDHILIDSCQVTNPPIDPLREPMELRTYIGRRPRGLEFVEGDLGGIELKTALPPNIELKTPITFGAMSYGAVSLETHKALAKAAQERGTVMNSGEGGLHAEMREYGQNIIVQVASGRFGVNMDYLKLAAAIEIKIGQGAKPGIGGHLIGEKVTDAISETRMIPTGTDAISPAPHHDIYSIEDLSQLIYALKEAIEYRKPVLVKVAAVHNVAAITSGIVRAGADGIVIDGFRGGTGAAPEVIRDHHGIPIELAIAAVDDRLRKEGIRDEVSLIASGGIRCSSDVAKIIALGADAVAIGTAALIAIGCRVCKQCHTGLCAWGICTQKPELRRRLDVNTATHRLCNLLDAWSIELKEILGALGMNAIDSLRGNRDRLRGIGLDHTTLDVLGIKPAGR